VYEVAILNLLKLHPFFSFFFFFVFFAGVFKRLVARGTL
jgi:hypothetical protein